MYGAAAFFVIAGLSIVWVSGLSLPDFGNFETRRVSQSTKIYDRTGNVLLYNIHESVKRHIIPFEEISKDIKNATVAIEDSEFFQHNGIRPYAILRAIFIDITSGSLKQGGSTITQQVIKNALLTQEKTLTRKLKEWILALKLEKILPKDKILEMYLNENPYGGNIYGVEEASQAYFGKDASDLTLAESAYIASLPQAPTYYSPYGKNKKALDDRKNLVLFRMEELGFITEDQKSIAEKEVVIFKEAGGGSIKAPHFSILVKQYLEEKYGSTALYTKGLKVTTTLDWNLEEKAEKVVADYAKINEPKFNARNAAMVGIDPKTGQVLVMVGSRDYFETENNGNFNVTTANRQPGSSFKPFVYAAAFKKGYTPETALFDLRTQFDTHCDAEGNPLPGSQKTSCYMPSNYDNQYNGPLTMREALAQSRNIPAIKTLYLVGINTALQTAQALGITTLSDPSRYGLTLVLGGGEVSLLEMTSAYSVFANDGMRNPYAYILKVEDANGNVLEEFAPTPTRVLEPEVARMINSILSDNTARAPAFGENSLLKIPGREVAAKTGTTNDYKDAWILGYTPNLVVGTWVGNNDNTSMEKKVAGLIVSPMWNDFFKKALTFFPEENFVKPAKDPVHLGIEFESLKPVLRGIWQGGETVGSQSDGTEQVKVEVHDILYWVDKSNPLGPKPANPADDSQFDLWEKPVRDWVTQNKIQEGVVVPVASK